MLNCGKTNNRHFLSLIHTIYSMSRWLIFFYCFLFYIMFTFGIIFHGRCWPWNKKCGKNRKSGKNDPHVFETKMWKFCDLKIVCYTVYWASVESCHWIGVTLRLTPLQLVYELPHDKTNKMACAPNKDSDQPGHPPILIRVFTVHMKKCWDHSYPVSA